MANQINQQNLQQMAQIDAQTFAAKYSGKKEVFNTDILLSPISTSNFRPSPSNFRRQLSNFSQVIVQFWPPLVQF